MSALPGVPNPTLYCRRTGDDEDVVPLQVKALREFLVGDLSVLAERGPIDTYILAGNVDGELANADLQGQARRIVDD